MAPALPATRRPLQSWVRGLRLPHTAGCLHPAPASKDCFNQGDVYVDCISDSEKEQRIKGTPRSLRPDPRLVNVRLRLLYHSMYRYVYLPLSICIFVLMYVICIRVVSPLHYLRVNCRRLVSLSLNTQLCFTKDKKKKKKQSRFGQHTKKTLLRMSSGLWAAQRHGLAAPFCGAFLPLGVSVSLFVRPSLSPLPPPPFPPACRRQVSPAHSFGFMYSFFLEETLESHLSPVTVLMST